MSFNGVWVWSESHGVPTSYEHALEMTESLQNIEATHEQAYELFAKHIQKYARQAKPYYDDESLNFLANYKSKTRSFAVPLLTFNSLPEELMEEISGLIVHFAKELNLVVLHGEIETVFLPNGRIISEANSAIWQDFAENALQVWTDKIKSLEQMSNERDELPPTNALLKKHLVQVVKDRLKQEGITNCTKTGTTNFTIQTEHYKLKLSIYPEIDELEKWDHDIIKVNNRDHISGEYFEIPYYIGVVFQSIKGFKCNTGSLFRIFSRDGDFILNTIRFDNLKTPEFLAEYIKKNPGSRDCADEYINQYETLSSYTAYINRCIDIFLIFAQPPQGLAQLYEVISDKQYENNLKDSRLSNPILPVILAYFLQSDNYQQMVAQCKTAFIAERLSFFEQQKSNPNRKEDPEQIDIYDELADIDPTPYFEALYDMFIEKLHTIERNKIYDKDHSTFEWLVDY